MIPSDGVPPSYRQAISIQNDMRRHVRIEDDFPPVKTIAGIDVGYDIRLDLSKAAMAVLSFPDMELQVSAIAFKPTDFPYIPGLLSFREAPVILKVLSLLETPPDMLMIDGHGIAHPRRLGIAAHIGVMTGLPAIGVAKSRLCGRHDEPEIHKNAVQPLRDKGETIGTVLRSRDNVKPLFISPGHRIGHDSAVEIVRQCLGGYRLPEPTRMADKLSKI